MDTIKEKYKGFLKKYKDGPLAVGWKSQKSQEIRFDILTKIGDLRKKTVLDYGCGLGDFYKYTDNLGLKYVGYDNNEQMVNKANKKYPDAIFKSFLLPSVESYDYVLASGVFNIDMDLEIVEKMIKNMWNLCDMGLGVNFLNARSKKSKDSSYFYPEDIISLSTDITKKFVVRADYKVNDFTIFLYR